MDPALFRYAVAGQPFYDDPARGPAPVTLRLDVTDDRTWDGWECRRDHPWTHWHPVGHRLPAQGWKIHVATTPDTAADTLRLVSRFCHDQSLVFKHLSGLGEVRAANAKDADRAAAGKFVTVYPEDDDRLHAALTGLDALLAGRPGPYVLSDLRWRDGPVHVRYGGFARAWVRDDRGRRVSALRDPSGALVEDRRVAAFTPPDWAPMPDALREQLAALGDDHPPAGFPYTISRGLHVSNAGGVYEATDPDGGVVVLKEGRPHAGLTPDGRDGASRMVDEEAALTALAGAGVVPVRAGLTLHGHRFLVLDRVDGVPLNTEVVRRTPEVRSDATSADRTAYRRWALGIAGKVRQVVGRIHEAGYVHGDLHPGNVLVTGDDVVLIDFEMSRPARDLAAASIGAPGFIAPDRRGGLAADRYALACLEIFLFCPLTPLLDLDPGKATDLLAHLRRGYGLDEAWATAVLADLDLPAARALSRSARAADRAVRDWDVSSPEGLAAVQTLIGRSLDAAADYSRVDRLWPGDPVQFTEPGHGLAHGAAGVMHAVDATGLDLDAQAIDWLDEVATDAVAAVRAARQSGDADLGRQVPLSLGLYDGLAGIGWLHRLHGQDSAADEILDLVRTADLAAVGSDLYAGLPGVGLYLLAESDDAPEVRDVVLDVAKLLAERQAARTPVDPADPAPHVRTDGGGLMWGATGTALFALRLYEQTGDPAHLGLAVDAVDHDLARCARGSDGSLQVNEGWRLMPYLATGSVGIGLVLAQLVPYLPDPSRHRAALDAIVPAACTPFTIEPGLFNGRAGMIYFLAALARLGLATPATDAALAAHLDGLRLHAVRHRTGIGFPGRGLLRLSCDLAGGSAGVLLALQARFLLAFDDERPGWDQLLPFLLRDRTGLPTSTAPAAAVPGSRTARRG